MEFEYKIFTYIGSFFQVNFNSAQSVDFDSMLECGIEDVFVQSVARTYVATSETWTENMSEIMTNFT
jgi:hypothetical protein